jgi:hypothetical protein
MKLFQKIIDNKGKIVMLSLSVLALSCSDFIDVDKDTDNPTEAPLNLLLTGIQTDANDATDFYNFTGSILAVYTHQMTVREEQDQYGTKVDNINMLNEWNNIYLTLNNIETLIKTATEQEDMRYVGIAQLYKVYLMSIAVDLWGDVPYTEASQLAEGITSPKFDDQREIYRSIMDLIDTAKENIASEGVGPVTGDIVYNGNVSRWIRFANTYKLKLYNQTRLVAGFDDGLSALLAENNFFQSSADDFQFLQTDTQAPTDERNKFWLESYNSTQFSTYMSPWFYEILKGMNPNIHTGIEDPRIPYYFYNQLEPGEFPPDQGDASTGNPKADYWDASTGFFSIRFGSIGPNRDFSAESSYTYPGIFPAGGRYDDGGAQLQDGTTSSGIAPHRILTYAEFLFIQAEMMHVGKMPGDAGAKLQEAITAGFQKIDEVVALNKPVDQVVPAIMSNPDTATYISAIMAEFNAASAEKKLEIIMTQKWIATFGDPFDQYNDYRRTGYPVLANPNGSAKEYQLDNGDDYPILDSETVLNNEFQRSFFYPQTELNANLNAPSQKNPATYKIFWDN